MNFIHSFEAREPALAMELKYCERCGGLWLRQKGADNVLCDGCRGQMAALLRPRNKKRNEQPQPHSSGRIDCLLGVAEGEARL